MVKQFGKQASSAVFDESLVDGYAAGVCLRLGSLLMFLPVVLGHPFRKNRRAFLSFIALLLSDYPSPSIIKC